MSEKELLNKPPPPHKSSGHLIRNLFLGSAIFGSALLLPNSGAYSQSQKWPATADKSATTKIMEVETMPVQMEKKKGREQLLEIQTLQASARVETGLTLRIGKPDDVNTLDRIISGTFFKISTPVTGAFGGTAADALQNNRVSTFYLHPMDDGVNGAWKNHLYYKPAGASYYKEGWEAVSNITNLSTSQVKTEVGPGDIRLNMSVDEGRTLTLGYDNDLNMKRTTITGTFLKITVMDYMVSPERGMFEIDGKRFNEMFMSEFGKIYYKPAGASYYKEVNDASNFLIVYDDGKTTGVMDRNTQMYSSIFNEVPKISPNPANQTATVRLNLDTQNEVFVRLYDVNGQELTMKSVQGQGEHQVRLDLSGLSSGMYYVKIHDNFGNLMTRPLSVLK